MSVSASHLRHHLLDLLIDGPSSFAALFGALVRHYGYEPDLGIDGVLDQLTVMERDGWIRSRKMTERGGFRDATDEDRAIARTCYQAWLPRANREELSLDEIGLWYEVALPGREEWRNWSQGKAGDRPRRWVLEDVARSHTISIQAESEAAAEQALVDWLSSNPGIELVKETRTIEPLHVFKLRDGTVVLSGVRLVCRYRQR